MKWYYWLLIGVVVAVVVYLLWKAWKESPAGQALETYTKAIETFYPPATRTVLFPTWSPTWIASPYTIPAQYLGEQLGKLLWGQR